MSFCSVLDGFIGISVAFLLCKQVGCEANMGPSHAGRVFLIFPGALPTSEGKANYAMITIINTRERGVRLRITCGTLPFSFCGKDNLVVNTIFRKVFVMNQALSSGITEDVIRITASRDVVVYLYRRYSVEESESLLLFPVAAAGTMYIFPVESYSFLVVFATQDNTDVYTSFQDSEKYGPFNYSVNGGTVYPEADTVFAVKLKRNQIFYAIHDGFQGRRLISTKPILVTGGAVTIESSTGYEATYMEESLLPASVWGKEYVVVPFEGCYIRVLGSKEKTTVSNSDGSSFKASPSKSHWMRDLKRAFMLTANHPIYVTIFAVQGEEGNRRSSLMVNAIPVEQFLSFYVLSPTPHFNSLDYSATVFVLVKIADAKDLCIDSQCGHLVKYSEEVGGYSLLTKSAKWKIGERHIVFHKDSAVLFGLYFFETNSATTGGIGFNRTNQACFEIENIPDDKLDNDCDNSIDEEEFDLIDNDDDGLIDEDSLSLRSRHGQWSEWGEWHCPAPCGTTQAMWRMRACNNPTKLGSGRTCSGDATQAGKHCTGYNETCKPVCSHSKWGNECENVCPAKCHNRSCDSFNGKCSSCRPGFQDSYCTKACPRTHYGKGCAKSCDSCVADCDPVTGRCKSEQAVELLTKILIVVVILPTLIALFYYENVIVSGDKRRDFYVKNLRETERQKQKKLDKLLENIPHKFHHRFEVDSSTTWSEDSNESDFILDEDDEETREFKILMKIYDKFSETRADD